MRLRLFNATAVSGIVSLMLGVGACSSPSQPTCTYALATGTTVAADATGGSFPVVVTTGSGCTWSAASNVSWVHVQTPTSVTGTGTVTFAVDPNVDPARTGTLTVAGTSVTVTQPQAAGIFVLNATLAQGLHLSGPYAATMTGPGGFSCSLTGESVTCAPVSYPAGTSVTLLVTITSPSFANEWPIYTTSGCDSTTKNSCTVLMNANRSVTIRAGSL
jgi:Putative binding domain, N-terminal